MNTFKLSRQSAKNVVRYLTARRLGDKSSCDVASALIILLNGEYEAIVLIDDTESESGQ